jgi:transposase-like protein
VGGKHPRKTFTNAIGWKRPKGGPFAGKAMVFGMVERGQPGRPRNRVRATVVSNHKASSLMPVLRSNVLPGSVLYTDTLRSYRQAKISTASSTIRCASRRVASTRKRLKTFGPA